MITVKMSDENFVNFSEATLLCSLKLMLRAFAAVEQPLHARGLQQHRTRDIAMFCRHAGASPQKAHTSQHFFANDFTTTKTPERFAWTEPRSRAPRGYFATFSYRNKSQQSGFQS